MSRKPALRTTHNIHNATISKTYGHRQRQTLQTVYRSVYQVNTTMPGVPDTARDANLTLGGHPALAQTTRGHTNVVDAVAFFDNGRQVLNGSCDCTLWMWDVEQGGGARPRTP
ncbi:hypothetical protein DFJ58DRAFT_771209 [Suillus subalutaceus]|uniref:uncharacterized protein n=1 Tax=Suillus subalutaceus TaxID=48586 RepID=UPI001B8612E2|nr:uncharacterized protein DFJ58DRAFT_771209 [Suillus subalutaceus]KAG1865470.1 hypothetical protein DFJ58DRAFT_771209 [Suillus subalutaceus]